MIEMGRTVIPENRSAGLQAGRIVLLLFVFAQIFAFLVFCAASVAVFHIFHGGIFFYKCMAISVGWSILFFFGFLRLANLRKLRGLLRAAEIHAWWFAFLNAAVHFLVVLIFVMIVPGAIDRSVSVFLVGSMGKESERVFSANELQQILVDRYVKEYGAIERRMQEQIATGTIVADRGGFRLTKQGLVTLNMMKIIAFIFNVDTRFVDPPDPFAAPAAQYPSTP